MAKTTAKQAAKKSDDELSFEAILEQLQGIVETLEQGDAPLEDALSTFECGVVLARLGSRRLDDAERRIEVLLDEPGQDGGPATRELDPALDD